MAQVSKLSVNTYELNQFHQSMNKTNRANYKHWHGKAQFSKHCAGNKLLIYAGLYCEYSLHNQTYFQHLWAHILKHNKSNRLLLKDSIACFTFPSAESAYPYSNKAGVKPFFIESAKSKQRIAR